MTSPALSPLARALARTDFAENWYRWCDARRDWAAEATGTYDEDSLLTASGVVCSLTVQLGRGLNSQECRLAVLAGGERQGEPEMLHAITRAIRLSQGEPEPAPPYPRPIIGSRGQLEVVSREIVDVLGQVARGWAS
ncbi:hypothetical protein ED92_20470 [Amycolatopsis sp. MJM2582]|uniref:hypothetical protein n=1 Tax=Amycolatopsis sp. MJM2582 TaxID=1427749 RepID=UPI0005055CF0|nr:hypothetical protein [Amycolatopsis sp. MJM2582]KFZ79754.1 hypothetical protein ED92_20470 [Amycolatopsis sp. MJM2582]